MCHCVMVYFLIKNYKKKGHGEKRLGTTALNIYARKEIIMRS